MKTYRTKAVEVKAVQWIVTHTPSDDASSIIDLVNQNGGRAYFLYDFVTSLGRHAPRIMLEAVDEGGLFGAHPNDFIIQEPDGTWTVKPADSFRKTYEEVTPVPDMPEAHEGDE